jgi:hypothetical protein
VSKSSHTYQSINQVPESMGVATFAGFLNNAFAIPNGVLGDVPLTQQFGLDPAFYTHVDGTAPVTLIRPGRYLVGYTVAALNTANQRSTSNWVVQFDRGGVDSLVDGLQTWCFHRDSTNGDAGSGGATAFVFQAGDAVRLSVQRFAGAGSLTAEALSCGLMLEKIE